MAVSKVILGRETLIDLTSDTVTASDLKAGVTAHAKNGEQITGTNTFDVDTKDATATATEIIKDKTAYVNGGKVTGTMPDRGAVDVNLVEIGEEYIIPEGYHNGSGRVRVDAAEQNKIIPENIKSGVSILNVEGASAIKDTSDATANEIEILSGKTAYVNGNRLSGTMPNKGAVEAIISSVNETYTVPKGYHNGSGKVSISSIEQAKIIPENIKSGVDILGVTGSHLSGIDTSDANAVSNEILSNKTAYVNGSKVTGTMINRGAVTGTISRVDGEYTVAEGYHNGNGKVAISSVEQAKIIPENIKSGVSILGVNGSHSGISTSDATAQANEILSGETAYVNNNKVIGTMPNNADVNGTISSVNEEYSIPEGYHNGNGRVSISSTEKVKIKPENIKSGVSILGVNGSHSGGIDTSDATATEDDILSGKTAYIGNEKISGTMQNRGAIEGVISSVNGEYSIPEGFHNGNGKVYISPPDRVKIIPENIKFGVRILGVDGLSNRSQEKTIVPYVTPQVVLPDNGYDSLFKVNVQAISYTEIPDEYDNGGITVIIGDVSKNGN